jgi:putative FmdB family regulatory protein
MPTYEYRCKQCGHTHEIEHGFHDERPKTCPDCGGPLARIFHPVGLVFKGSGFHKTDYSGAGTKRPESKVAEPKSSEPKGTDSKPAESKSSDPPKGDAKTKSGS